MTRVPGVDARGWSGCPGSGMGLEIERKFLVTGDGWRTDADAGVAIRQGYLATGRSSSVRVRVMGDRAMLNIKEATAGLTRIEYDYPIPVADAEVMLARLCEEPPLLKVRYRVPFAGRCWEVDVFEGANAGLVLAEVELDAEDERLVCPDWVGEEVSHDLRYYNVCLARAPIATWPVQS